MDWFLYDKDLRHEIVNNLITSQLIWNTSLNVITLKDTPLKA